MAQTPSRDIIKTNPSTDRANKFNRNTSSSKNDKNKGSKKSKQLHINRLKTKNKNNTTL